MKKLIKITAVVGAIIVVLGIVCIVAGISKGGSNIVKEEIGKTFAKAKVKIEKNDTTGMTKLQNNSDTIDMLSVNNLRLDLSTASYDIEEWNKEQIGFSYDADIMEVYYLNEGDSLNVLIQYKKKWKKGERDVTVYLPEENHIAILIIVFQQEKQILKIYQLYMQQLIMMQEVHQLIACNQHLQTLL